WATPAPTAVSSLHCCAYRASPVPTKNPPYSARNDSIFDFFLARALRWHYATDREHRGLSEARANACEIVAWRFLTRLSERQAVEYCLYEIPGKDALSATLLS